MTTHTEHTGGMRLPWLSRVGREARRWLEAVASPEQRFELVAVMTLLLLLLYTEELWYLRAGVFGLAVAGLLYRPYLRSPLLWFGVTFFLAVGHARLWFQIDNHEYLITYWCFAIALATSTAKPEEVLRVNARYLIGLAFLFAVIAKVLSPDYLSGAFFEATSLSDPRFYEVASLFGGLSVEEIHLSNLPRSDLIMFGDPEHVLPFRSTPGLAVLAQVLTWWTILIEAWVALVFLWPEDRGPSAWRDPSLLLFITTTYFIAPVIGFAWVLTTMAVAQCSTRRSSFWVGLYVLAYIAVMISYHVPVARILPF